MAWSVTSICSTWEAVNTPARFVQRGLTRRASSWSTCRPTRRNGPSSATSARDPLPLRRLAKTTSQSTAGRSPSSATFAASGSRRRSTAVDISIASTAPTRGGTSAPSVGKRSIRGGSGGCMSSATGASGPTCASRVEKAFKDRHCREVHYKIHTGEKPYKCHICNQAFPLPHRLTNHLVRHTKDNMEEAAALLSIANVAT